MMGKRLQYVALALGAAWACWWVFFEAAEALGDRRFTQPILFLVVMFGAVAIAWKWPAIGAVLFLAEAVAAVVLFVPMWAHRFSLPRFLILFAMMPLPPPGRRPSAPVVAAARPTPAAYNRSLMRARVYVSLKTTVLDPQGQAVRAAFVGKSVAHSGR